MYFNKYPFSHNFQFASSYCAGSHFQFAGESRPLEVTTCHPGVFRLTVRGDSWDTNYSQAELTPELAESGAAYTLDIGKDSAICLRDAEGRVLLESLPERTFGKCGQASMFRFCHQDVNRYYGAGSKSVGFEHTGLRTKFWNTDVFADFPIEQILSGRPDPYYISIPYLIIQTPSGWVGLLYNNPEAVFLSVAPRLKIESFTQVYTGDEDAVLIGAESGQPDLFILAAPSLSALTRQFQQMVGTVPRPPLWALGYQQCRWGYRSVAQLQKLRQMFEHHDIPVDGLWLDIDYMDGFRVFTADPVENPDFANDVMELAQSGHPVVPIIDPGVKMDGEYPVYRSGHEKDVFCKNPEGQEFVGLVWPGLTVFPDFSREEVRQWWADQAEQFAHQGFVGAWLDMNDPAVGKSNPYDMRFGEHGEHTHESFHNQYALGMIKATRDGFERANPGKRVFLLSRSSSLCGGKYSAVWTGDNVANFHYLKMMIPNSLNLSLSGIPFNGADVGGFDGDTHPELLRAWMKAAFLTPFFRNHSVLKSLEQEPWAFDQITLDVCRLFIRLRYWLMPYLYQQFIAQEERGETIMRPLFYDFESSDELDLAYIDDAFMVGPAILHAPCVSESGERDEVPLPGGQGWYQFFEGNWVEGGTRLAYTEKETSSGVFFKEGSIIPLRCGDPATNKTDLRSVNLLVVARAGGSCEFSGSYQADDGETLSYRQGEISALDIHVRICGKRIEINCTQTRDGYGDISTAFSLTDSFDEIYVNGIAATVGEYAFGADGESPGDCDKTSVWHLASPLMRIHHE